MRLVAVTFLLACASDPEADDLSVEPGEVPGLDKADAAENPQVELKVTVAGDAIDFARDELRLQHDRAERRAVHFYDTLDLALFEQGVILRSRKVSDGQDDSTVKVRPLEPGDAPEAFIELAEFECETDWVLDRSVASCKIDADQDTGEIDDVASGDRDVVQLFSSEQEDLVAWAAPDGPSWSELYDLGPTDAWVWKISSRRLPARLTAEHWVLPDGTELLELSMRVDADEAEEGLERLLDWLDGRGITLSEAQETKTRLALEYFARELGGT